MKLSLSPALQAHRPISHAQSAGWLVLLCVFVGCASTQSKGRDQVASVSRVASQPAEVEVGGSDASLADTGSLVVKPVAYEAAGPDNASGLAVMPVVELATGMTLDAFESLAMEHNPAIQQASAVAGQAAGVQHQVGLKPNPTVGYFAEEVGNEGASGLHGAFVSQTIVRGNKLGWNRAVASQEVQRTRWIAEAQRQRVRNDIRIQFYAALGAQRRLELARQFRHQANEGLEISRARVEAQEAALPDVLQSEVQLSEVDLAIQRTEYEFQAAWQRLASIAGVPELAPSALTGDFDAPECTSELNVVYDRLVAASPLLAAACARVQRTKANLKRQQVQSVPNLNAQLGTGYDDATGDEFANVQLSIPLPVHNQNQGNIQAAYAEYCAATQNVRRLKMQLRRDLATAMQGCRVAKATVTQYETVILPKVRQSLDLMEKAQRAGEFDFLRVLTARRAYFDANLKYVAALTDLSQANASINGMLLTGALDQMPTLGITDDLRGAALSGQ